ncbi:MAG: ABC transporter permease [Candidatus Omnitrophica bacterium]|nr:ABC transporter permease [Candidatus Omnitrophota bacterium]
MLNKSLFFLASRFIGKRGQESFVYFASIVSVVSIALGVASLMLVLGIMNGFSNDLKRKIVGANPHIIIEGNPYLDSYRKIAEQLKSISEITGIGYFTQTQIIYKAPSYMMGGYLRGIEGEGELSNLKKFLKQGSIEDFNENEIILGSELANELGVNVGDTIFIIGGLPAREFLCKIIGIVEYGIYNVDVSIGVVTLKDFQKKFFSGKELANIGITVVNIYHCRKIAEKIARIVPADSKVITWIKKNKILFAALSLEKKAMLMILTIIILVASFNIASSLMMTVYRKIREIGVLKTLGMTRAQIRSVFLLQGFLLGLKGLIGGLIFGGTVVWVLKKYNIVKLPEYIYSISYLPIELSGMEVLMICASVFFMTIVASVFPACRAGNLEPATAIRYE